MKLKKAETAELKTHDWMRDLILAVPDLVYFKDRERRYLAVNKAFEKACGRSRTGILGKTGEDVFSPEVAAVSKADDDRVLATGETLRVEESMNDPEGRVLVLETIKAPYRNAADEIVGLVGVSRDISARKKVEAALTESEERFRTLYENATVGLYRTTPDGRILLANPALVRMMGYDSFEELAAIDLSQDGQGPDYARSYFTEKIRTDIFIQGLEAAWKKKDGTTIYVRESARAVLDRDGRVKYYEGTVEDVTARKRAELELQASEKKFRRIFDNSLEGIFQTTVEGRILAANKAMARMFGFRTVREFMGENVNAHYVDPGDRAKILEILKAEDEIHNREIQLRRKDGTVFHALLNATVLLDAAGRIDFIEGMLADISILVDSKAALQAAVREKEALIKETHHRVKNNMQVISGLLSLQSRRLRDPEAVKAFRDSQLRIRTISQVHDIVHRSHAPDGVELDTYLTHLAESILGPQEKCADRIALETDLEPVRFNLKTAIALGLIVHELVTNAARHAFPGDRRGTIRLSLRLRDEKGFLLSVRDDGVGLPPEIEIGRTKSTGLQLVEMLSGQLEGTLESGPPPGTDIRISFRIADES